MKRMKYYFEILYVDFSTFIEDFVDIAKMDNVKKMDYPCDVTLYLKLN